MALEGGLNAAEQVGIRGGRGGGGGEIGVDRTHQVAGVPVHGSGDMSGISMGG